MLPAVIGLAALWLAINLDQHDAYGFPIECGNGFSSHLTPVVQTDGGDVVTNCQSALLTRRVWAINLFPGLPKSPEVARHPG